MMFFAYFPSILNYLKKTSLSASLIKNKDLELAKIFFVKNFLFQTQAQQHQQTYE